MEGPLISKSYKDMPQDAPLVDTVDSGLEELFFVRNSKYKNEKKGMKEALDTFKSLYDEGELWVYYPWKNTVVHILGEEAYFELRTARNRNIITDAEQKLYRDSVVGVAGLSVGSSVVSALVMSGGPKTLKVADPDIVEITNLNRLKGTLSDVGTSKVLIAARNAWDLDPFAVIHMYTEGVTESTLKNFLGDNEKLSVCIDENENIQIKILLRLACREKSIPVVMATDNGDGVIIDVERFDMEPDRELFHGLIGKMRPEAVREMDFKQWVQLATKIVGPEYLPPRMQESILELGKTLPSIPQLGTSATVAGATVAYVVRRISTGASMPSGRYLINFEETFDTEYCSEDAVKKRNEQTEFFKQSFH
jgi:hypothetical protein